MTPLEWEKSRLKSPLGEDTPVKALMRKWRHRISIGKDWMKLYGLMLLGILLLFLYIVPYNYWYYGQFTGMETAGRVFLFVLVIVWIGARFQLVTAPALLIGADAKRSLWTHFRETLVNGSTAAKAIFFHSLNRGAWQFAAWGTIEVLVYVTLIAFFYNYGILGRFIIVLLHYTPCVFVYMLILAMMLCALGIIGVLIKNHPAMIFGFVLIPVLISLISLPIGPVFEDIFNPQGEHSINHPFLIFAVPEMAVGQAIDLGSSSMSSLQNDYTTPHDNSILLWRGLTGPEYLSVLKLSFVPAMFAIYLWAGIWIVLWWRLRSDEEKLDSSI